MEVPHINWYPNYGIINWSTIPHYSKLNKGIAVILSDGLESWSTMIGIEFAFNPRLVEFLLNKGNVDDLWKVVREDNYEWDLTELGSEIFKNYNTDHLFILYRFPLLRIEWVSKEYYFQIEEGDIESREHIKKFNTAKWILFGNNEYEYE